MKWTTKLQNQDATFLQNKTKYIGTQKDHKITPTPKPTVICNNNKLESCEFIH